MQLATRCVAMKEYTKVALGMIPPTTSVLEDVPNVQDVVRAEVNLVTTDEDVEDDDDEHGGEGVFETKGDDGAVESTPQQRPLKRPCTAEVILVDMQGDMCAGCTVLGQRGMPMGITKMKECNNDNDKDVGEWASTKT